MSENSKKDSKKEKQARHTVGYINIFFSSQISRCMI